MTSRPTPIPDAIVTRHRQRIEKFVVRARRIEAHSLLVDRAALQRWTEGTVVSDAEAGTLTWSLPPEEAFESLATRIRPLLLDRDGLLMETVLGSLKSFVRDDQARKDQLERLLHVWSDVRTPANSVTLAQLGATGVPEETYDQVAAADRWMYVDLVHADDLPPWLPPLHMRYPLAVMVFGKAAMVAVGVLELVRRWDAAGLLSLDPVAWEQSVTARVPFVMKGSMRTVRNWTSLP